MTKDTAVAIAERLRQVRARFGFPRRMDMARFLDLPSSTYSAYESDSGPPKVDWLIALAVRGVNLNWLLTGEGEIMLPSPAAAGTDQEPVIDEILLAAMIRRVEREQEGRAQPLAPLEKADMVARLYLASQRLTESELASEPLRRAAEGPER